MEADTDSIGYWLYGYWEFLRGNYTAAGKAVRGAVGSVTAPVNELAFRTESPTLVRITVFTTGVVDQAGNMVAGVVDLPGTISGAIDDVGQSIETGKEHGWRVGAARQIGLLQFSEAYYGTDIMTREEVDPWLRTAEGSARFGGTAATAAGVIKGVPSLIERLKSPGRKLVPEPEAHNAARFELYKQQLRALDHRPTFLDPTDPLVLEVIATGEKCTPTAIRFVERDTSGQLVWLEEGNARAGWQHVSKHANDFVCKGILESEIQTLLQKTIKEGRIVEIKNTRPVYEVMYNGRLIRVAITIGDNGFIVGANPN
jgi:hypothetical protein